MCLENYMDKLNSPNNYEVTEDASMELLIELHYQISDMNYRLNEHDYSFLKQILILSEMEIRRQMASA